MRNSVPAYECINLNAEQVLILENQLCPIDETFLKTPLYTVKCVHVISSDIVVCFVINTIPICCLCYVARCAMNTVLLLHPEQSSSFIL